MKKNNMVVKMGISFWKAGLLISYAKAAFSRTDRMKSIAPVMAFS
jgi:hypothetical protein